MGKREELAAQGDGSMEVDKENTGTQKRNTFFGSTEVNVPRENGEVKPFMKDCMIEDWDLFEQMMDYAYDKCLVTDHKNHGALFSEAPVRL